MIRKDQSVVVALKEALVLSLGRSLLEETQPANSFVEMLDTGARMQERQKAMTHLLSRREAIIDRAQYAALRGVLALEAGDLARAEQLFRAALRDWEKSPRNGWAIGFEFPYRAMVQEYLQKLAKYK
jgi:hypothetical protein